MLRSIDTIAKFNTQLEDQIPTRQGLDYEKELQDYYKDKIKFEALQMLGHEVFPPQVTPLTPQQYAEELPSIEVSNQVQQDLLALKHPLIAASADLNKQLEMSTAKDFEYMLAELTLKEEDLKVRLADELKKSLKISARHTETYQKLQEIEEEKKPEVEQEKKVETKQEKEERK